mgnify:CR=1 FL=1
MMAYATVEDVQARMTNTMSQDQQSICSNLLDDAAVIIDAYNADAELDSKKLVSVRMVIRAMEVDEGIPIGATQGSMSALGYSQSWTTGQGSSVGELYLAKLDKKLLGVGNRVGSWSPVQELAPAPLPVPDPEPEVGSYASLEVLV